MLDNSSQKVQSPLSASSDIQPRNFGASGLFPNLSQHVEPSVPFAPIKEEDATLTPSSFEITEGPVCVPFKLVSESHVCLFWHVNETTSYSIKVNTQQNSITYFL